MPSSRTNLRKGGMTKFGHTRSGETACRGRGACATIGAMEAQRSPVRRRGGQTMVEYVLAFVVLLGVVFALGALVGGLRSNGSRTLDLVASEYP